VVDEVLPSARYLEADSNLDIGISNGIKPTLFCVFGRNLLRKASTAQKSAVFALFFVDRL
jgi:hypothetical protein